MSLFIADPTEDPADRAEAETVRFMPIARRKGVVSHGDLDAILRADGIDPEALTPLCDCGHGSHHHSAYDFFVPVGCAWRGCTCSRTRADIHATWTLGAMPRPVRSVR